MENLKSNKIVKNEVANTFPVPFSISDFRKDVTEVFFHYVRTIAWLSTPKAAMSILNVQPTSDSFDIYDPDQNAFDLDITYENIRDTQFAIAMEQLYEYAFHGRWDASAEDMAYESYFMWVADLVSDAVYSEITGQWGSYGLNIRQHAENCLLVAEIANARNVLEGGESFSYFSKVAISNDSSDREALTIRQMAQLSGMEEMSIRSAANPKRANPLITFNDDGTTKVKLDVAKEWLKLKGKYVPIEIYRSAADIDLTKTKFSSYDDLWLALNAKVLDLAEKEGKENINNKLNAIGLSLEKNILGVYLDIDKESYANEKLLMELAGVLQLPVELFVLRCTEVVALENLKKIQNILKNKLNPSINNEPE